MTHNVPARNNNRSIMLKKATMTSFNTPEHDSRAKFLIDIFMFSTLFNLMVCEGHHFHHSYETNHLIEPENGNRTQGINELSFIDHPSPAAVGLSKMVHWIFDKDDDDGDGNDDDNGCKPEKGGRNCGGRSLKWIGAAPRFAGHRKRLQFALLPIMYKMGVMTTLLTGLTIFALKGLAIGVILLIFAFGHYFTKVHKHGQHNTQPIHVHVHSAHGDHGKITSYPIYESGIEPWDRITKEATPTSFLDEDDYESYRKRLIQNSAASLKFKPVLWPTT